MFFHIWATTAIAALIAIGLSGPAMAAPEIPAKFQGEGCNLKYTYARTPKNNTTGCVSAKADYKEGEGHDNDNFIRITKDNVGGVEWGCTVKTVKSAGDAEFTFDGDCGGEGVEFASTVTLLLRPGKMVIVDQVVEGRHMVDVYRLNSTAE
jgi:hypothetical protein